MALSKEKKRNIAESSGVSFAHYGEERQIEATDEEAQIFEALREYVHGAEIDPDLLRFVRKSDNYATAVLKGWDLARFKYTARAKWISFPTVEVGPPKHRIEDPSQAVSFEDLLTESLATINKFNK